eukprot:scaffold263666_cov36-Tisochrysis_lutea.AAC.1
MAQEKKTASREETCSSAHPCCLANCVIVRSGLSRSCKWSISHMTRLTFNTPCDGCTPSTPHYLQPNGPCAPVTYRALRAVVEANSTWCYGRVHGAAPAERRR